MRRLKKRAGNRLAKVRYYDKNAQNAVNEEEAEVIGEESEEVVDTEEVAEEEPEVVEEVEVTGTDEPEVIEEVGKITEPEETTEEEEETNAIEDVAEAVEPEEETETTTEVEDVEEIDEPVPATEEKEEEEPEVVEEVEVAGTNEPEVIEEVGKITEPEETTEEEEETNAIEDVAEAVEPEEETETTTEVEDVEEVPLEYAEEESDVILEEEGSLDGSLDEVAALAEKAEEEEAEVQEALKPEEIEPEVVEEVEVAGTDEPEVIEEVGKITEPIPTTEEEEEANAIEEVAEAVEPETENTETTEEVEAVKEVAEVPTEAEKAEELAVTATEELAEEPTEEVEESEEAEEAAEEAEEKAEAVAEEKPAEKETFKLTAPSNLEEILSAICVKRGRKLIYRPNEILFNETATVLGTDKNNEEGIKVKNILDEEIKQGVKLGYIDKYDGLKMSEIKEEYENDTVYEYAEQEFKRTGLLLDGDKVKVYIYDWDMKALHHIGYIEGEEAEAVKPYLIDREKYSFDICGLITGGKYRKVIKDESGKVTVEKGNDGKLGVELDISVIARKD